MSKYRQKQQEAKEQLTNEYAKTQYTMHDPYVCLDPFGISPLTAIIWFDTEKKTRIDLEIAGRDCYSTIRHSYQEYNQNHRIPVYGLYPDKVNIVTLTCTDEDGNIENACVQIKTAQLPSDFSYIKVHECKKEYMPSEPFALCNASVEMSALVAASRISVAITSPFASILLKNIFAVFFCAARSSFSLLGLRFFFVFCGSSSAVKT